MELFSVITEFEREDEGEVFHVWANDFEEADRFIRAWLETHNRNYRCSILINKVPRALGVITFKRNVGVISTFNPNGVSEYLRGDA